jgi:membrane-bound serine protease (ClpP class)
VHALSTFGRALRIAFAGAVLLAVLLGLASPAAGQAPGTLYLVEVDGVITAPTASYLGRSLRQAEAANAQALLIRIGSEGGVLRVLRSLARELYEAEVPVVVYVAPGGRESGAAGALLLSAAHIAAIAPGSSFGSATPLAQYDELLSEDTRQLLLDDLSRQLREWNTARGRGAEWVERGVNEGVIVTSAAASAAQPPAVDIVAPNLEELLVLLEGRVVTLADGSERELRTLGLPPQPIAPSAWEWLRLFLADPTISFLLFVLGCVAIYGELANPGTSLFAGIGVVLLSAAILGGMLVLPVRPLALLGLIVGALLIGADLLTPSHGGLTVAGITLIAIGGLTLIDPLQAPGAGVALWAILAVILAVGALALAGLLLIVRARRRPVTTGREGLIGALAEVRQPLEPDGMVFVEGALWRATTEDGPIPKGVWVKVAAIDGLRLIVRRLE